MIRKQFVLVSTYDWLKKIIRQSRDLITIEIGWLISEGKSLSFSMNVIRSFREYHVMVSYFYGLPKN